MRALVFVISLLSFVMYRAAVSKDQLQGTWNGNYRTAGKTIDLKLVFGPANEVELYSSEFRHAGKAVGTYALTENKLSVSCLWPGNEYESFIMNGRLSQKQNYVNGTWETDFDSGGNFFLARTIVK